MTSLQEREIVCTDKLGRLLVNNVQIIKTVILQPQEETLMLC